jgi:hypothetical protein
MAYSPKLHEEEIKNKVAHDVFDAFDCTRISMRWISAWR